MSNLAKLQTKTLTESHFLKPRNFLYTEFQHAFSSSSSLRCHRPQCSAIRQVFGSHVFRSFLFSAFLFNSAYDASFRNSFIIPNRFLPLGLFPIIRPSITYCSRLSPLSICKQVQCGHRFSINSFIHSEYWPIQFFFLLQITSVRLLFLVLIVVPLHLFSCLAS